mgnify:CR=1 FL=1
MFLERIADVLIYIGKNLSFYGASATEIEYYISKISEAYDIDVNIAAIGTVITLTVVDDHGKSITRIERVSYSEINFEKLSLWENMIKRVTEEKPTIFTLKQWIKDIEKKENLLGISFWKNIIAVFIASFGFCFVFRGNYTDAVASGISALLVYILTAYMMFKFRKMYPLGTIERGYVAPWHPLPALLVLVLASATLFGMYFGYWVNLVAGFTFYLLASLWFVLHRFKFLDIENFISAGCWPRPRGY